MGGTNALATYQRHMMIILLLLIGKIYHVFIDDIIIWSCSIKEHEANIQKVLQKAQLYCLSSKTDLFTMEICFLGHIISDKDI